MMDYLMSKDDLPKRVSESDYGERFRKSFLDKGMRIGPVIPEDIPTCPNCTATAQELASLRSRLVDVATSIRKAADEIGDHPAAAMLGEVEQVIYAETERLPRI